MKKRRYYYYKKYDIFTPFCELVGEYNRCKVYNDFGVNYFPQFRHTKKRVSLSECINEYLVLEELSRKCIKFKKMVARQNNKYIHRYRTRGLNMKFKTRSLPVEGFCDMSSSK